MSGFQVQSESQAATGAGSRAVSRVAALVICAYFLYFAAGALRARFAADDMMNLGQAYERGAPRVLFDTIAVWSDAYRPTGGLFYLLMYYAFGLNPMPYRIALLAIIAGNVYLTWRIALRITASEAAAALAATLACAHANMVAIYHQTSFVYDVLAYFFLALMLVLHIEGRSRAGVVLAYFAAINAKEIAMIGALWVFAYDVLIARPRRWFVPIVLLAMTLVYAAGRLFGPGALGQLQPYRMELNLHRFAVNNRLYLNDLLYVSYFDNSRKLLLFWAALALLCGLLRSRELWWCWFMALTATLPISFTIVPRAGPGLYLALLAWALWIAMLLAAIARWLPRPGWRWFAAALIAAPVAAQTISLWGNRTQRVLDEQRKTWSVITQLRDLGSRPEPHSRVIFLSNPFEDWDTYFAARLLWRDRSIDIQLANKLDVPPSAADLDRFDWILTFENGNIRTVRRR